MARTNDNRIGLRSTRAVLVAVIGLSLVAISFSMARANGAAAAPLFWVGLLTIYLPASAIVASRSPVGSAALTVIVTGALLYLVKVLYSPLGFAFNDEFIHWRALKEIQATGHLFAYNPLLPIAAGYPGLAIVLDAITSVTGLHAYAAGLVTIGMARIVLLVSLLRLLERVSGSARVGLLGTLLYMANPAFYLTHSQVIYGSLAWPLGIFALTVTYRFVMVERGGRGLLAVAILAIIGVTVTHHLSSFFLVAVLVLWALVAILHRVRRAYKTRLTAVAALAILATVYWVTEVVGLSRLGAYLGTPAAAIANQITAIFHGTAQTRHPFENVYGQSAPLWQEVTSVLSVFILLTLMPFGMYAMWKRGSLSPLRRSIVILGFAYPFTLVLRLIQAGQEAGFRSSPFVFLAVTPLWALGWATTSRRWNLRRPRLLLFVFLAVIFVGGTIAGIEPWLRMPGPYLVEASARSVDGEGIAAAKWVSRHLGAGNRFAADQVNRQRLAAQAMEFPVWANAGALNTGPIFLSTTFSKRVLSILGADRIQYLLVDRRLSTGLPHAGAVYIEAYETGPRYGHPRSPVSPLALGKFWLHNGSDRIYDSKYIAIYDVRGLSDAPR